MNRSWRRVNGVTLVEVILALTVAGVFLSFSLKFISSLQYSNYASTITTEVNDIFLAMDEFYRANCAVLPSYDCTTTGVLNQSCGTSKVVVLGGGNTNLLANYLITFPFPENPYVNSTDTTNSNHGFVAQFTKTLLNRTPTNASSQTGTIVFWSEQVAVRLAHTAQAAAIINSQIPASCISSLAGNPSYYVTPCATPAATTGEYLVWMRTPAPSAATFFTPVLKMFQMQYNNNELYGMAKGGNSITGSGLNYNSCGE